MAFLPAKVVGLPGAKRSQTSWEFDMTTVTAAEPSPTALETNARPWGFLLIQGIAMIIIGAIMLWAPAKTRVETYTLLVALLGIYWIISGVLDLVHMFTDHKGWGWKLLMGLVSIMAGFYIVAYPTATALALPRIFVLVLGIWGVMQGILMLVLAFKGGGWGFGALGVIGIVFGGILIANYAAPGIGLSLVWVAAIWAFIGGFFMIFRAFQQRKV
jgi:uncharacterized membrane protein HdeD (DUF308 family)